MDQATLVDHQIDDVTKLVDHLRRDAFDVKAVFWLFTSEADQWFLYIASDAVDQKGITDAYKAVMSEMRRLPDLRIDRFQVKLVAPDDPIAKAVIDFVSRQHPRLPTRFSATNLGKIYIENAYIYNT
jgi:hypothetical protein